MSRADGGYVVIELNGAADFDPGYVIGGEIFAAVADALHLPVPAPLAGRPRSGLRDGQGEAGTGDAGLVDEVSAVSAGVVAGDRQA